MHRTLLLSIVLMVTFGWSSIAAWGSPISTIQFPDGNVLNVLGTAGSGGPNTAYLDVDFSNNTPAGSAYAWQYNWSGTATETDMLNAVEAVVNNPNFVDWDSNYAGFIDNFNYGSNVGAASPFVPDDYTYWASYIGSYDSTDSTYSSTQNINWVYAPLGADDLTLGDEYDDNGNLLATGVQDLLYGWTINGEYQATNLTPNLPEVVVPEPASLGLLALAGVGLLTRRCRARSESAEKSGNHAGR